MNVLLIDTGYEAYEYDEPLGIEQLDACIRDKFNKEINLSTIWLLDEKEYILEGNFDVILVSGNIYDNGKLKNVIEFYSSLPNKPRIVVGGVIATLAAKELIEEYPDIICIVGEGEETIVKLLELFYKKKSEVYLQGIPNLVYKEGKDIIVETPRKIADLSTIEYVPNRKYLKKIIQKNGLVRVEASRGCDWNRCTFCIIPWKYAGCRRREFSDSRLERDLKQIIKQEISCIYFTDEEFFSPDVDRMLHRLLMLKQISKDSKYAIDYVASTSVRLILELYNKDEEFWIKVKQSGFSRLFVGIESLSDIQLKRFSKGSTYEENIKALEILKKADIFPDIGFIMFDPFLTREELYENLSRIKKSPIFISTARLTKKLRVIKNTTYYNLLYKNKLLRGMDKDGKDFMWDFESDSVAKVFNEIVEYEKYYLKEMYALQSKIRAKNNEEDVVELCKLRGIVFTQLWEKIQHGRN